MPKSSRLVLNCDPEYTAHREAAKRREDTGDWLRVRERTLAAPSIARKHQNGRRAWGARATIRSKRHGFDRFG